jgi:hypothetical protein
MARDLLLNLETHDLDLTNLQTSLTVDEDGQSLQQRLKINLLINVKEWFFNQSDTFGLPYLRSSSDQFQQFILSDKTNDISIIDAIFKEHILKVEGVSQLLEYSSNFDKATRTYNFNFTVSDINGSLVNLSLVA